MRPPFPTVIDASLIAAFRSCPRRAFFDFFQHWKSKTPSVHLHAGAAYARGLEVARLAYYSGDYHYPRVELVDGQQVVDWKSEPRSPGQSLEAIACGLQALLAAYGDFECPPDSAKSCERMAGAFEYYFQMYPFETEKAVPVTRPSGKRGIEFSFAEPIDFIHPETGNPLVYVGRFDMLCDYMGGIYGEDDKTTSSLGASWSKQWDLRSQFTGYCWGARRQKLAVDGFLVRGISILKTKYDTQQAVTYRPQWMIDEWEEQLLTVDLPRMVQMWESEKWAISHAEACTEYGGCQFRQVCLSAPENRLNWLRTGFERRSWDPVSRLETLLDPA